MVKQLRSSRNVLRRMPAIALALSMSFATVSPVAAQSLTDRFKSLFGGKSDEPAPPKPAPAPGQPAEDDVDCPQVTVRAGASTYAVGAAGKPAVGNEIRFQASITKMARECARSSAGITARIGIQGRVIAGPAGAPATVEVPLRVAVVQGGVGEKVIASKAYRTTVEMSEGGSVPFTFIVEDLAYPTPSASTADSYVFYVGFDPQALSPEPKGRKKK
ncbi:MULTISPECIES: hypothetical protein [Bradyrhizobium]|jgi:hypothetical protein|uniref:DUF3426 domain-containing protein n=1 Tax=Bradyrhizobium ottawaense TaxID=931866 RepID=A0ABV4FMM5_9BRAD|nr:MULTISPECIES: hypothetical protein [Bradyrhizobium]MBR1290936.1 hypothetical protein [Bradyrhizobium ottawaense]MDA9417471.1 hypothetical protein [Bradyrhizobium sp. CCBAU 25360]MDA9485261.1 hypothetical protein [Bradyrhizobium sp. CCBAU 11445]WLB45519.1 hypothetical protein QIH93_34190 [Bradyrhizobium ottawaense]WQN82811.1 hypothetical protein U7859_38625 [Bradyrhizobium ottawaense]